MEYNAHLGETDGKIKSKMKTLGEKNQKNDK